ncbi:DUF2917 domain-containing protein [Piscinibacter sakaiensis]|uniref:DUF2917 domain-containing protein n=1 Tax=Piscinibacter sakaiensis TaxID=1547922 RepID=A0A0K8P1H1_PISS1|nr:DUF2917 domain-containing protein [Piscinibacter sakaiensis]GAP36512.1 hypothetical protein ISF6_2352 [Piscinibacter sakaiensis]
MILPLPATAPRRIDRAGHYPTDRAMLLSGVRGLAWVTVDGEEQDHVLGSGQRLSLPAHRTAIITPLWPGADFELRMSAQPGPAPRPALPLHRRLVAAWRRWRPGQAQAPAATPQACG